MYNCPFWFYYLKCIFLDFKIVKLDHRHLQVAPKRHDRQQQIITYNIYFFPEFSTAYILVFPLKTPLHINMSKYRAYFYTSAEIAYFVFAYCVKIRLRRAPNHMSVRDIIMRIKVPYKIYR